MVVEYDGTDFCGFQAQGHGERTVQSALEQAVHTLMPHERIVLHAAGRTDTGVHALGQVVSFQTAGAIPVERMAIALNSVLPRDIAVASVTEAPANFHARFSARSRTYSYLVWTRRTRSALWGRYSLHFRRALDVTAIRAGAQSLMGTHDFAAFARAGGDPGPTTVREVQRLSVRQISHGALLFTVTANGFLRGMVRNFVGVLLCVGAGSLPAAVIADILATRDRTRNPCASAAPHGLCLLRVNY